MSGEADHDLGHGRRLSGREYEKAVVALYDGRPPSPSREQDAVIRRRELDLMIDHKLGVDFPQARRDALWAVQQRVERRRVRLMLRHLVRGLFPGAVERGANRLAGYLVGEYAKVLTEPELDAYFRDERDDAD